MEELDLEIFTMRCLLIGFDRMQFFLYLLPIVVLLTSSLLVCLGGRKKPLAAVAHGLRLWMVKRFAGCLELQREDGIAEISATLHSNFEEMLVTEDLPIQSFASGNLPEDLVY